VRKNYPGKRIIGDLSNQERVLEFLDLRIVNFTSVITEKIYAVKTPTVESKAEKADIVRNKKSKYDLQPYIYRNSHLQLSQTKCDLLFSLS
jgi:hypothetical protein